MSGDAADLAPEGANNLVNISKPSKYSPGCSLLTVIMNKPVKQQVGKVLEKQHKVRGKSAIFIICAPKIAVRAHEVSIFDGQRVLRRAEIGPNKRKKSQVSGLFYFSHRQTWKDKSMIFFREAGR